MITLFQSSTRLQCPCRFGGASMCQDDYKLVWSKRAGLLVVSLACFHQLGWFLVPLLRRGSGWTIWLALWYAWSGLLRSCHSISLLSGNEWWAKIWDKISGKQCEGFKGEAWAGSESDGWDHSQPCAVGFGHCLHASLCLSTRFECMGHLLFDANRCSEPGKSSSVILWFWTWRLLGKPDSRHSVRFALEACCSRCRWCRATCQGGLHLLLGNFTVASGITKLSQFAMASIPAAAGLGTFSLWSSTVAPIGCEWISTKGLEYNSHGLHRMGWLLWCCHVRFPTVAGGSVLGLVLIFHSAHCCSWLRSIVGAAPTQLAELEATEGNVKLRVHNSQTALWCAQFASCGPCNLKWMLSSCDRQRIGM